MIETPPEPTVTETARSAETPVRREALPRASIRLAPRSGIGGYIAVALLALAVGAAGAFAALRYTARGTGAAT